MPKAAEMPSNQKSKNMAKRSSAEHGRVKKLIHGGINDGEIDERRPFDRQKTACQILQFRRALNRNLLTWRFAILESSVCRGMPSFAAAPDGPATRPSLSASAASMSSLSRSAIEAASRGVVRDCRPSLRSHAPSTENTPPSDKITDRSITFCSSRMLPGQL